MPDKDEKDQPKDTWAGTGFSQRNEESAPEPDDESWVWE
jgi:hypothetical protein